MKEHTFMIDLAPTGLASCVWLDGEDISGLLRGIVVRSSVDTATEVELIPVAGHRVSLVARLPEARITIHDEAEGRDVRQGRP